MKRQTGRKVQYYEKEKEEKENSTFKVKERIRNYCSRCKEMD